MQRRNPLVVASLGLTRQQQQLAGDLEDLAMCLVSQPGGHLCSPAARSFPVPRPASYREQQRHLQ